MKNLLLQGAQTDTHGLVQLRHLAPLLNLKKQKKVLNELSGSHTSNIRGRGVDFSEVRSYQAGDDIRGMDWRVTARTGVPHIKLYQEERERPVHILCDLRANMFFGSQVRFKSLQAVQIASLLSWAALAHGDRIGGLVVGESEIKDLKPKGNKKGVLNLLQLLNSKSQAPEKSGVQSNTDLLDALKHLRRTSKPGSALFLISDFQGFNKACEQQLYQLSRHNDVTAINVYDLLEAQLPPAGVYQVSNGEERLQLNTQSKKTREAYKKAFNQRQQQLHKYFLSLGIPLISLNTQDDPVAVLQQGLGITGGSR